MESRKEHLNPLSFFPRVIPKYPKCTNAQLIQFPALSLSVEIKQSVGLDHLTQNKAFQGFHSVNIKEVMMSLQYSLMEV